MPTETDLTTLTDAQLDERAGFAMGFTRESDGWRTSDTEWRHRALWHPTRVYDDAHELIAECGRRGVLAKVVRSLLPHEALSDAVMGVHLMLATPREITIACVTALESAIPDGAKP